MRGRSDLERSKAKSTNVEYERRYSIIDMRTLPPAQRHRKIFQLVNELAAGGSFILVNDHDPKPLYYRLEAEYPKQFQLDLSRKRSDGMARHGAAGCATAVQHATFAPVSRIAEAKFTGL